MTEQAERKNPLNITHDVAYPKLTDSIFGGSKRGKFVAVRLAGDEDKRTHLGIYMGDMPRLDVGIDKSEGTPVLTIRRMNVGNPAIYVPALNQIVYGMESWWGEIASPDDLKQITDQDIDNVWYVQALRSLEKENT